uniref:Calcineurin-like phosphoesterase domain-containing protein n=1 Tax=Ditylenchus dipsaci TaxID=166011 RepID=A0A915D1X5_9BILA
MDSASKKQPVESVPATSKENAEQEGKEPSCKRFKLNTRRSMNLAVAGCSHGEMDRIYDTLSQMEHQRGVKFDLLICCGDFQAIRNYGDLQHLKVPDKFRQLMTFYKYYSGKKLHRY